MLATTALFHHFLRQNYVGCLLVENSVYSYGIVSITWTTLCFSGVPYCVLRVNWGDLNLSPVDFTIITRVTAAQLCSFTCSGGEVECHFELEKLCDVHLRALSINPFSPSNFTELNQSLFVFPGSPSASNVYLLWKISTIFTNFPPCLSINLVDCWIILALCFNLWNLMMIS